MWTYIQRTGNMYDKDGKLAWTGYAGNGEGLNNPDMENVHQTGPLPRGLYTIGQPYRNQKTGIYTMNLIPDPNNEMFGRADFRIHGDNGKGDRSASEGCIVKSPQADRELIWNSGDRTLKVVAEESEFQNNRAV